MHARQMRDLLDRRPEFVAIFDKHPEELMRIGRAPDLKLILDANKELKAVLDKKQEVRALLESHPDLDRSKLQELIFSSPELKGLYDSRPELKEILQTRAQLFEEEMKSLDEQKPEAFVAGPLVRVSCKYLVREGVLVGVSLPPKMVQKLQFEFSSVKVCLGLLPSLPARLLTLTATVIAQSGTTHVLAQYNGQSALAFDLQLEELLDMQHSKQMVKDQGKIKLDVRKTLYFLNERMRF